MGNDLLKDIKETFEVNCSQDSLVQVGSSINNNCYNDIDLLVITNNKRKSIKKITEMFKNHEINYIDDAIRIMNYLNCNIDISFAIYEYKELKKLIFDFYEGKHMNCEHKTWSIGYWLIEGFLEDLKKSKILIDKHNISNIVNKLNTPSIYGYNMILKDCLDEINIKSNMKSTDDLDRKSIKIDLLFASLRALSIIDGKPLRGFKRITKKIEILSNQYRKLLNPLTKEKINKIKQIIIDKISENQRLYIGTWEFNKQFKKMSDSEISSLIKYAEHEKIECIDTALVYGNVEEILSYTVSKNTIILTKIPAKIKPNLNENKEVELFYSFNYIEDCIKKSLKNLKRDYIDIVLLHNWTSSWNNHPEIIEWLNYFKEKGLIKKIGISLPNKYNERLSENILNNIDVIEAPLNSENQWIKKDIGIYKENNIEIILRSLFLQGEELKKNNYKNILATTLQFNTSVVLGMTTKSQIKNNTKEYWRCRYGK